MKTMNKILLLIFLSGLLSSCVTFNIAEKWMFTESKYKAEEYCSYIDKSNLEYQDKSVMKRIVEDLAYTDNAEINRNNDILFNRKYIQINDSIKLEYFEFQPKVYTKSGIFFLGNGSNIVGSYKRLEELAIKTQSKIYVLNYRGYGKSEGVPSFKTVFEDNNYFFNAVKKTDKNINFVIGYSLGSISATYLAVENKIDNLVLLAPFSNANEMIAFTKKKSMRGLKSVAKPFVKLTASDYMLNLSNSEKLTSYDGRLIISHAIDDNMLPFEMAVKLYSDCPSQQKELLKIDKGGHNAPLEDMYWQQIISKLK